MLDMIRRVAPKMRAQETQRVLAQEADAIRETAEAKNLVPLDRADVESAWTRAKQALEDSAPKRESAAAVRAAAD
jgi:hypothetical protein